MIFIANEIALRVTAWQRKAFRPMPRRSPILSELPHMPDVMRWAVLTMGTGLGNASDVNHRR